MERTGSRWERNVVHIQHAAKKKGKEKSFKSFEGCDTDQFLISILHLKWFEDFKVLLNVRDRSVNGDLQIFVHSQFCT